VHPPRRFRFRYRLLTLEATLIDLCASLFNWASYQRTKGAVKLHLLLDHQGYLPQFVVITSGKTHEIQVARGLHFQPGTILILDRGYVDYAWFERLTRQGVFFVTRLRHDAHYRVLEECALPQRGPLSPIRSSAWAATGIAILCPCAGSWSRSRPGITHWRC
jgi:hypothetical protein